MDCSMDSYTFAIASERSRLRGRKGFDVMPKSLIVDAILEILFIPWSVLACALTVCAYGILLAKRKLTYQKDSQNNSTACVNGSSTARFTMLARANCAGFGFGPDMMAAPLVFATYRLIGVVDFILVNIIYWTAVFTFWIFRRDVNEAVVDMSRCVKGNPNIYHHLRTCWIDDMVETFILNQDKNIDSKAGIQVVLLGAGFDTRAYGRLAATKTADVRFYEVDTFATQSLKRRALSLIRADTSHVEFVTVDFEKESWFDILSTRSSFDRSCPTCVVWEGVTMYLTASTVESTLRDFAQCANGSIIGFDYFSRDYISCPDVKATMKRVGEAFIFGLDNDELHDLAEKTDVNIVENLQFQDVFGRYLPHRCGGSYMMNKWEYSGGFAILQVDV